MKGWKIGLLAVALLCGLMTTGFAGVDKNTPAVSVTGHAKIAVTPNVAYFNAGIITTGADVETARAENDRIMRRIIDAIAAQGIDRKKIATTQFSVQPLYRNDGREGGVQSISGYRLQNSLTVTVDDLQSLGTVIDAAFQAGANQFYGLRFGVKDESNLKEELLRRAVRDGRAKAQILADALGVTLGQPLAVSEAGGSVFTVTDSFPAMRAAAAVPVEAGAQTISLDVNLVFAIGEPGPSNR